MTTPSQLLNDLASAISEEDIAFRDFAIDRGDTALVRFKLARQNLERARLAVASFGVLATRTEPTQETPCP